MFASEEHVKHFHLRTLFWKENGFPTADELLIPLLDAFTGFDTIATVWSCQGHPETASSFYLMLSVTEEGFVVLQDIYTAMSEYLSAYALSICDGMENFDFTNAQHHAELSKKCITPNQFSMTFTTRSWTDKIYSGYHPVINLNVFIKTEEMRKQFILDLTRFTNRHPMHRTNRNKIK